MKSIKTKEEYLEEKLQEKDNIIEKLTNSLNSMPNQNDFLLEQNKAMLESLSFDERVEIED